MMNDLNPQSGYIIVGMTVVVALMFAVGVLYDRGYLHYQASSPVKVELSAEVKYEIQKQVQREMRKLTKPVLPMVAPNPKVKVKR